MNPEEFKLHMPVKDTWWPREIGFVEKITKSTVTVGYPTKTWTYDKPHMKFLEKVK